MKTEKPRFKTSFSVPIRTRPLDFLTAGKRFMKEFLKKVFFHGSPEKGAFWGLVLLLSGTWLLGTLFLFSDGIAALGVFVSAIFRRGLGNVAVSDHPWQLSLILPLLFFMLHYVFQLRRLRGKFEPGRCDRTFWKWTAVAAVLWGGMFFCTAHSIGLAVGNYYHDGCFLAFMKDGARNLPYWMTAALLLLSAGVLAEGKVLALIGNFPLREIFTLPVKILAGISFFTYLSLVAASMFSAYQCEAEKEFLGKHFDRPLTAEALKKLVLRDPDEKFWNETASLISEITKHPEIDCCFAEFAPGQLDAWRKKFSALPEIAKLDRMIEKPLPACPWKSEKYNILLVRLDDCSQARTMARLQMWHIRFALEKRDRAAVMAALKRLDHVSGYLAGLPFYISAQVKMAVERMKIEALSHLLAEKILIADDLIRLKERSRAVRKELPAMERNSVWSEALMGVDFIEAYVNSAVAGDDQRLTPLKRFRWLLPQFWLIYERNRLHLLRSCRNAEKFHDMPPLRAGSVFSRGAEMVSPPSRTAGASFLKGRLEQEAAEFFIDQELYRLKHGRFPDGLPPPVDPFCGKPMKYIHGSVTVEKEVFGKEKKKFSIPARQLTSPSEYHFNVTVTVPAKGRRLPKDPIDRQIVEFLKSIDPDHAWKSSDNLRTLAAEWVLRKSRFDNGRVSLETVLDAEVCLIKECLKEKNIPVSIKRKLQLAAGDRLKKILKMTQAGFDAGIIDHDRLERTKNDLESFAKENAITP